MKQNKRNNPDWLSGRPSKKQKDEDADKRLPDPDDPNEEKGPPVKEMPIKNKPNNEEDLD